MISSGMREIIKYLCQHKLIDVIVCTGCGVEEDVMKTFPNCKFYSSKDENYDKEKFDKQGNILKPKNRFELYKNFIDEILDESL